MTTDRRTFIVADWLEDDRPGAPSRQPPAFEGILTGYWNGFAEWKTNRRVIEAYISELERLRTLDPSRFGEDGGLDRWYFDDDRLVLTWDDGEEFYWIVPDDDGLYDIGLGMVWTTYDQYDVDADLSAYTLYRMEDPRDVALDQIAEILFNDCPTEALVGPFAHAIVGIVNILFTTGRRV